MELVRHFPSPTPSDEDILARILAGEVEQFELLMRRHNSRAYRAACAIVRDAKEAEDVMQDAYLRAYEHLGEFEGRARFSTWLTRIAVHEALARVRRGKRFDPLDMHTENPCMFTGSHSSPEQQTSDVEMRRLLEAAVSRLPDGLRDVFVLRAVEGRRGAEVAECLGISENTVKTRLYRARSRLQAMLIESMEPSLPSVSDELRASEARSRVLLGSSPLPMWVYAHGDARIPRRERRRGPALRLSERRRPVALVRRLWTHQKGGFYHDGRFATLLDVVDSLRHDLHARASAPVYRLLAVLAVGSVTLGAGCTDNAIPSPTGTTASSTSSSSSTSTSSGAGGSTPDGGALISQFDLRNGMRGLWEDHVTWTRVFLIDAIAGLPDTPQATARLLQNQVDLGDAIKPFYGNAAGDALAALLHDHITGAAALVTAAKAGDATAVATAKTAWYANADAIAKFLSDANPNWPLADLTTHMHAHLDETLAEATARLTADWAGDVTAYDAVVAHILMMADVLGDGIAKQFPDKVSTTAMTAANATRSRACPTRPRRPRDCSRIRSTSAMPSSPSTGTWPGTRSPCCFTTTSRAPPPS